MPTQFSTPTNTSTITPTPEQNLHLVKEMSFLVGYFDFAQSPNQELIAVNENDFVKVYQAATEEVLFKSEKPFASSPSGGGPIEFSPDGTLLAADILQEGAHGPEGVVYVWSWPGQKLIYQLRMPERRISDLNFSPKGNLLAIATSDGWTEMVEIWNVQTGNNLASLETPGYHLVFSPSQPVLATGELLGPDEAGAAVKLWDLSQCKFTCPIQAELFIFPKTHDRFIEATSIDISKNGRWLAAVIEGKLQIWDLEHQQEVNWPESLHMEELDEVAFSGQDVLATLGLNGHISLFTPETGEKLGQVQLEISNKDIDFSFPKEDLYKMRFSFDGKTLLTAGIFAPLQIWALP